MRRYAIGLDYGTLSVRALLVDIKTGEEVATSVYEYPHGVMETHIPTGEKLPPNWALQDPQDYLEGLIFTVKNVVQTTGVLPEVLPPALLEPAQPPRQPITMIIVRNRHNIFFIILHKSYESIYYRLCGNF